MKTISRVCIQLEQARGQSRGRAAAAPAARPAPTLPRQASLNWVPLPQPRGHGNPILRFLQQVQRATGCDQRGPARKPCRWKIAPWSSPLAAH